MKKVILSLTSAFAVLAVTTSLMTTTTSCKKDDVAPSTTTGVTTTTSTVTSSFDNEQSGKIIYVNLSDDATAPSVCSFFSLETGNAIVSANALSTSTGASFQFVLSGSTYQLQTSAVSSNTSIGGNLVPFAANFASTTLNYDSATPSSVSTIAGSSITFSTIVVSDKSTILVKNKAGKVGLMYLQLSNDNGDSNTAISGAINRSKLTFKYKLIK